MNTDIIKGRAKSAIELFDNFNQPLHLYDAVLVEDAGLRLDLIIKINDDKSIKLWNCSSKKYSGHLLLANKIVDDNKIKDLQNKYFSHINSIKRAKEEKIAKKIIFGMWKNMNTGRFGICNIIISSKPGKTVLRSEIKNKINEVKDFCKNNPQYKFLFFGKTDATSNIDEAYVYPEGDVERNVYNFVYNREKGIYHYIENPATEKDEFTNIVDKSFFLTIHNTGNNIAKNAIISKYFQPNGLNCSSYSMTAIHSIFGFYSQNCQKIYCHFFQNTLLHYSTFIKAFKAFTNVK